MANDSKGVSRRDLLKRAGLAGAALSIPSSAKATEGRPDGRLMQQTPQAAAAPARREPVQNLTQSEADLLEAICARIIPTDENGPGAREARAAHYIDRALGGALKDQREAYRSGLAALERYCLSSRRQPFLALDARNQDSVLIDVETGAAASGGFPASSAQFFAMVRTHTLQGTFGDPFYGGNKDFIGWDLIAFPGLRLNVTADDQRLGSRLTPTHRSAYDHEMFNKAVARRQDKESVDPKSVDQKKSVAHDY
ncbi:MAG TPA: gluconate 2-dehydrogenase subunit 3 family protein [Vicinamibacterales bacterium]|nr:gluconate 2-dehydrogenase subunit 3 family protein [Vicinamibacterales bacterium]